MFYGFYGTNIELILNNIIRTLTTKSINVDLVDNTNYAGISKHAKNTNHIGCKGKKCL